MTEDIQINLKNERLFGSIAIPQAAKSLVIFAHGSGSGRLSPRNKKVANSLNHHGFATCLFDLLTAQEDRVDQITMQYRFDIQLLARRLVDVTDWLVNEYSRYSFNLGYFGASTGAAAALIASANGHHPISAVVCRGGRADLAKDSLVDVTSPTLFIVGGDDTDVIQLNRMALVELRCEKQLAIIPHASHLFEEANTLEEMTYLAIQWFTVYLSQGNPHF